ncbi:MAG: enoyl-CoA hydratase/isomerase family protein [Coriobacteriales bacterium]
MTQEHDTVYMEHAGDGVAVIYLNQPRKKNAINARMMELLAELLMEADEDDGVRAIVLRGSGNCFTSGGDLSQSTPEENTPERARKTYRRYCTAVRTMRSVAKPIVAMVDGYAVGGGFALMLASDLICIAETATIIPAFCQIGIAPEMGVVKMLPELVGMHRAKEIVFLGERISGRELFEMGCANRVCPSGELEDTAMGLARRLAAMPDASIQVAKGMFNALADANLGASLVMEQTASPFCTTTAAYAETQAKFAK